MTEYLVVPDEDDFDPQYVPLPEDEEELDFPEHPPIPEDLEDFEE